MEDIPRPIVSGPMNLLVQESRNPMNFVVGVDEHYQALPIRIQRDFHPIHNQLLPSLKGSLAIWMQRLTPK